MTGDRPTRIALVTQWYPPEPAPQPQWIAQGLIAVGDIVRVLTGVPNYPSGRVVAGYSAWRRSCEAVDGVLTNRTPLYPSHDANAVRRFTNYATWAASSAFHGQFMLAGADVVLVYSSPATAALAAMVAERRSSVPYVLLIQDVWPDSVFSSGFLGGRAGRLAEGVINRFVLQTYRRASAIVVTSPGMKELLTSRGVPVSKIHLVYNWIGDDAGALPPRDRAIRSELRGRLGLPEDSFILLYAGNHGAAQALDHAIDGMEQLSPESRCHLVMVGDGVEREALMKRASNSSAAHRVHLLEPVPRDVIQVMMADADAQLVSLADRPLFEVTMPSKLQAALASGRPVLVSGAGDVADAVRGADAGRAARPGAPSAFAGALESLASLSDPDLDAMGARARTLYDQQMSERVGSRRLSSILRAVAHGDGGRRVLPDKRGVRE